MNKAEAQEILNKEGVKYPEDCSAELLKLAAEGITSKAVIAKLEDSSKLSLSIAEGRVKELVEKLEEADVESARLSDEKSTLSNNLKLVEEELVELNQKLAKSEEGKGKEVGLPEIEYNKSSVQALKPNLNLPGVGNYTAKELSENKQLADKVIPLVLKIKGQTFCK